MDGLHKHIVSRCKIPTLTVMLVVISTMLYSLMSIACANDDQPAKDANDSDQLVKDPAEVLPGEITDEQMAVLKELIAVHPSGIIIDGKTDYPFLFLCSQCYVPCGRKCCKVC